MDRPVKRQLFGVTDREHLKQQVTEQQMETSKRLEGFTDIQPIETKRKTEENNVKKTPLTPTKKKRI